MSCAHHDARPKVLAVSKTWKMRLTVRHTNPMYDNDVHVRPLTNRLTTAANAQPRGPAPTTQPASHPTGDDVQTVDTHDQKGTKLAQPTPETFPELSNLPGSGTNDGDRYNKPNSGRRHKTHQTQSMAAWATTRMRKMYISQNTEIVVQK